ncbi:hypothetical protein INR49_029337 [Caranx melampygus]|nr:hypothetical protein INR49_029337 [Caranx melampygus]
MSLSVMKMDSTHLSSAMALLDIVGVWTVGDRRDREPGHHLEQHIETVTNQMNQSVLKLTVSITETVSRPPVQRDILYWEPLSLSVMKMDSTHLSSVTAPLDIVGVWTVMERRDVGQEQWLVKHPKTVVNQKDQSVQKLTVSTTETVSRPPLQRDILYSGQERPGTRTPPGTAPRDCDRPEEPERPKTHCEHRRDSVQTTSPEGYPLLGAFVPQCDENGQYTPQQRNQSVLKLTVSITETVSRPPVQRDIL